MSAARRIHDALTLLGSELPICASSSASEVVRAASRAGAVGVLGATQLDPESLRDRATDLARTLDGRPFCVDLGEPSDTPEAGARLDVALDSAAPLVALGDGVSAAMVQRVHDHGKRVIATVGTPRSARAAVTAGADVLVAHGHVSVSKTGPIGTFSLEPAVGDDVGGRVPVVAAGGIATGRHMAAALALGASGFWLGATWLLTTESDSLPAIRERLLAAGLDDDVVLRESEEASGPPVDPDVLVDAIQRHQVEDLVHRAGRGVAFMREVSSVAERITQLRVELAEALADLAHVPGATPGPDLAGGSS